MARICQARGTRRPRRPGPIRPFRIYSLLLRPGDLLPGRGRLREIVSQVEGERPAHLERISQALFRLPRQDAAGGRPLERRADRTGVHGLLLSDGVAIGQRGAADLSEITRISTSPKGLGIDSLTCVAASVYSVWRGCVRKGKLSRLELKGKDRTVFTQVLPFLSSRCQ